MQEFAPWVAVAISAAALLYTVITNNNKSLSGRIDAKADKVEIEAMRTQIAGCVGRVDIVEDRVSRIETEMGHLPDKDTVHEIALQVSEARFDIRALAQSVDNIRKSVEQLTKTVQEIGQQPQQRRS